MVEKFGKKLELCSKFFDYAAHNGSNYLNGHCMVSILLSFPVWNDGKIKNPDELTLDYSPCMDERIRKYGEEDVSYLPLACYLLRWNIEVSYYKEKNFWSLEEYRIRSREGIERLVSLQAMPYSTTTLLPYSDETFSSYKSFSAQETRFAIGQQIQASIIFNSFAGTLETVKKAGALVKLLESYIQSWIGKMQNL